ncbi:MAG TPA: MtnX-like HAD-IB family phosphatase [Anaeromyxobacteraceae bacterium]|nr:MtnX-like HAD-IB family phosphatase [Anaeromyxobacteraceae bacterium]
MGSRPGRWAVVCDFDGTAVTEDLGDQVSIHFAGRDVWCAAEDRYRAGEITFAELLRAIFAPITAPAEEIAAWARDRAVLRSGFEAFVRRCREAGVPFLLVSAGLDVYIHAVLERLPPELHAYVEVRSNRATCSPFGLTVDFHPADGGCDRCGFCKGTVVEELRERGHQVAVLGDGTADRCAAERADLVYARGRLPHYCEQMGVAYHRFETFDEVAESLFR